MYEKAIVLTGGIASGKSTVCNLLKLHGFSIIDADEAAHKVLDENSKEIAKLFGKEYIKDSKVDRKRLGKLVFENKVQRTKLEKLAHPLIKEEIAAQSRKMDKFGVYYFIDIPLFFEKGGYDIKKSVLVYAPRKTQSKRLIEREGLSEDETNARLDAQMNIEEKREKTDFVVDNSKDLKHLQKEVERLIDFANRGCR